MNKDLLRRTIEQLLQAAEYEDREPPDIYGELLDEYHATIDPSWMPQGYGVYAVRDPRMPRIPVDMSELMLLEDDGSGALWSFMRELGSTRNET